MIHRLSLACIAALACACSLPTHGHESASSEAARPAVYPDRLAHAPRPLPDRVVLTWRDNPARTQAVTWRTDTTVTRAVAEIAPANESGRELKAQSVLAETTSLVSNLGPAHYHSVAFSNLTPDTLYAYRVGDGVNWSEWHHFRTAHAEPRPFSFIYFGDAQNEIKTHWSRVFREAFREAPRAAFTLHAGDLVSEGNNDEQWGEWFGVPAWVNATIPVVPSPGNHEYRKLDEKDEKAPRTLSRHWRPQFALPENGPSGIEELRESAYYIDYQGARIVSLNSNEKQQEQGEWLRAILKDNPQRWTIVTFHHPVFSPAKNRDNAALREAWKPIFDEYRVDLVLTGHDHTYARSGDVSGRGVPVGTVNVKKGYQQAYDPAIGTVYVVSVSGPKMYDITGGEWAVRLAEDTQLFQVITVDGDELRFEARTAVNRLYDAFALKKRTGQPNQLIELLPAERRRKSSK